MLLVVLELQITIHLEEYLEHLGHLVEMVDQWEQDFRFVVGVVAVAGFQQQQEEVMVVMEDFMVEVVVVGLLH